MLPTDAKARKDAPMDRGLLKYFPDACAAVAELSRVGNEQHNPGQPMHWAREKSTDHGDCIVRHQAEAGTVDSDGMRHSTKVAWRALAQLQLEIEAAQKPMTATEVKSNWIAWYGARTHETLPPGVTADTQVVIKLRSGVVLDDEAYQFVWHHDGEGKPGGDSDIVAYRVVKA